MKTRIPSEYVDAYKRHEITIYDISELVGKSPSTVYHALQDENVDTTSHRKRKEERNKKLIGAYASGERTLEEVGGQFGITKQRAQQIIDREAPATLRRKKP